MDYDWKYYMDDLKAGKSRTTITAEDVAGAGYIMERLAVATRKQIRQVIRNMLAGYREQDAARRMLIEKAMKLHGEYCGSRPGDELAKRRHNAAVYRYMMKTALNHKAVAKRLGVSADSVSGDISRLIDELAVILIGIPALPDEPGNWPEAVRDVFENMRLLECGLEADRGFTWQQMETERIRGRQITSCSLGSIRKALLMYEEYCSCCLTSRDIAERSLEAVRSVYLDSPGKDIAEVAEESGVSVKTIYEDMKRATGYLAELIEHMASLRKVQKKTTNDYVLCGSDAPRIGDLRA